ncbi:MAG: metallophosphoesterase family protein [Verrucomicrobiales bacterium]
MKLGFLSDAHGNPAALEAGLDALAKRGVTKTWFLGDAFGYVPGDEVLRVLKKWELPWILGNHDALTVGICAPGENAEIYNHPVLDEKIQDELRSLPDQLHLDVDGRRFLLVHGSPADPTFGYVYEDTNLKQFGARDEDFVVMGHTHRPFVRPCGKTVYVNAGSCAMPRDGDLRGAAAVVETRTMRAEIIRFEIGDAIRKALSRGDLHPVVRKALERLVI